MYWVVGKVSGELEAYLTGHSIAFGQLCSSHSTPSPRASRVVYVDYADKASVLASVSDLAVSEVTGLLVAGYESYVMPSAWLSQYFGVPGPSEAAAQAATNKSLMRAQFRQYDQTISPDYASVTSVTDALSFAEQHGYPIVMKPTNLSKSRFVATCHSAHEVRQAFKRMQSSSDVTVDGILVEQYLDGTMYTVAGFADADGTAVLSDVITQCTMARELGIHDNHVAIRTMPANIDTDVASEILNVASAGVIALQLTSVALHIELILTMEGPKIVEIGARLGGYRAKMYSLISNIDLFDCLLEVAAGRSPTLADGTRGTVAAIELFPPKSGVLQSISGTEAFETTSTLQHSVRQQASTGDTVGLSADGYQAVVTATLAGSSAQEVNNEVERLYDSIKITVT